MQWRQSRACETARDTMSTTNSPEVSQTRKSVRTQKSKLSMLDWLLHPKRPFSGGWGLRCISVREALVMDPVRAALHLSRQAGNEVRVGVGGGGRWPGQQRSLPSEPQIQRRNSHRAFHLRVMPAGLSATTIASGLPARVCGE